MPARTEMRETRQSASASVRQVAVSSDGDTRAVDLFLQALARAVRQFHTYPPSSPLCTEAIAACQQALAAVDRPEPLPFRVTPRALLIDEIELGAGTIIEHELVRRLVRARVATLRVDRTASVRDLSRFSLDLLHVHDDETASLAELLGEHGVASIIAGMAARAEVFDLGAPRPALRTLVEHERSRHEPLPAGRRPTHLYPPGKGWIRLDPGSNFGSISLVDLAILVQDPGEIATMLLRLTGDASSDTAQPANALERKFGDVAKLFGALDPDLSRLMFSRLARAVLALEPERRRALLRQTILPALLDGRADAAVLQDFPDPDLAESLCLLLDLETAAPDVLAAALDRLDLSPDRRQAVVPLLEAQIRGRTVNTGDGAATDAAAQRYAARLLRVDPSVRRSFSDLNAFDLSIDEQTTAALTRIREEMIETDPVAAQLGCLVSVIRLEPNPSTAETLLARASALLSQLEDEDRFEDVVFWLSALREIARRLREQRPDVADAVDAALGAFCTRERALRVLELLRAAGAREAANAFVESCGRAAAGSWLALLKDAGQSVERAVVQLLGEHAATFAPALAARLDDADDAVARAIIRVLSYAGAGYENAIAAQFRRADESTIREALRALARMGTAEAAAFLVAQIEHANPRVRAAAEESLWHLPPDRVQIQVRELLGRRDFVMRQAAMAGRMIDRASRGGVSLAPAVAHLASLRFQVWRPAVARVGRQAHKLVAK